MFTTCALSAEFNVNTLLHFMLKLFSEFHIPVTQVIRQGNPLCQRNLHEFRPFKDTLPLPCRMTNWRLRAYKMPLQFAAD